MGVDPGTASTGYGVIEVIGNKLRAIDFGVVETSPNTLPENRLEEIFTAIGGLLERHQPSATAVESLFFNVNVRTALAVGQARGVALLACSHAGCEVFEYTPQQIKQAVAGYGKADKRQVMEMVRVLLGLTEAPRPDHAADALGVAICHANTCGVRERLARHPSGRGAARETKDRRL
jgi:crossover junction endodeoxyribonuclease RuvC